MLFTSFPFVVLVILTLFFFYCKHLRAYQTPILITSSFIFYAYGQPYLLLLLFISASINAVTSYLVYFENSSKKKKRYAFIGVLFNLTVLAFFKYSPLFGTVLNDLGHVSSIGELLILIPLPVGISFYTFQGISLVIDLYRSNHQSECPLFHVDKNFRKHYTDTFFFITFFPQLVAGPIVKAYQFYPQIKTKYFKDIDFHGTIKILILGYFLKMVIADNLKNQTFWMTYPYFESLSSFTLVTLLVGYSVQIFADFAGYSLIAIGIAKLYGYDLPINFNFPYISQSFSEFWTRWHISLSTWLKEYLYIPLGGNRRGERRTYLNLIIVMLLGGLWHGAAWSYMVWGGYHGMLLMLERYGHRYINLPSNFFITFVKTFFVFSLITLGWLLFKLPDFSQVLNFLAAIISNIGLPHDKGILVMIFFYSLPILIYHLNYLVHMKQKKNFMNNAYVYAVLLFLIVTNSGSSGAFIYFQF
ncbi:MBOAT family protein [Sulfurovum sp.]|uniref:MBOAT family O-acyltransferase n=1 Tax=Sulfurovum sp. TaxID=1969726 RepID=UPI0035690DBE